MDSTSIDLVGSRISEVVVDGDTVKIRFEPAYLIKTMTGSVERTRWWQNGYLVFGQASLADPSVLDVLPAECAGGDVGENIYTYRDMLPVPLESAGQAHCALRLKGDERLLAVQAGSVRLELEDVAKYIEHIRPE
jgi:hypothetical protein